ASGTPPPRAANALPSATFARAILLCWAAAVPLLTWGLAFADRVAIRIGAASLLIGLAAGATYIVHMLRRARTPTADETAVDPAVRELFRTT
ncbi:MAG TPA: hypothetical protein VFV51_12255, partial [Vicinamibacterales bacterium]|nr:hypothetical protein [Vicinamibacterales bacterium]